jgi:hypothetical protein
LARIRVTRRTHIKKPWYERPALLFIALALALGLGGVLMAHLFNTRRTAVLGGGGGLAGTDSAGVSTASAPAPTEPTDLPGVLTPGATMPSARPGMVYPPMLVGTLGEDAAARGVLRKVRYLGPVGSGEGAFAFVEGAKLIDAGATGTGIRWDALPLRTEQRGFCDFEVHREAGGTVYLVGFVTGKVAQAIAALGPGLVLPAAGGEAIPKWQFWRGRGAADEVALRQGSEIAVFPDLGPEATCIVALPMERLRPLRVRRVEMGLPKPAEVIEVALR